MTGIVHMRDCRAFISENIPTALQSEEMLYHTNIVITILSTEKKCAVKDLIEGAEYEFRVSAINISGAGEPSVPSELVFARDPKSKPGSNQKKACVFFFICSLYIFLSQ